MKLHPDNLPASLRGEREVLGKCIEAMNSVTPVTEVYLFGSHARGEARKDSDVDLCIVAKGAAEQMRTAAGFRRAIIDIWPRPAFSLVPISPERLQEKKDIGDYFYRTVLKEGVLIATEN